MLTNTLPKKEEKSIIFSLRNNNPATKIQRMHESFKIIDIPMACISSKIGICNREVRLNGEKITG